MPTQDLLERARELLQRRAAHAWVTVVAVQPPSSSYIGAQAIVEADGSMHGWIGGGCVQGVARTAALRAMDSGKSQRLLLSNSAEAGEVVDVRPMSCASNGSIELFIQPAMVAPLVRIYGRAPVADIAASLARTVGFDVLTIPEGRSADAPRVGETESRAAARESYALLATQGDGDTAALESALRSGSRMVLLIASRTKAERLRASMRDRGFTEEQLACMHAPAGPHIGAIAPEEIALAAVAGLVAARRGRLGMTASRDDGDVQESSATGSGDPSAKVPTAGYVNPVCGAVIDPARAVSRLTVRGQTHYFCCEGCRVEFERDPEKYLAIAAHMRASGPQAAERKA